MMKEIIARVCIFGLGVYVGYLKKEAEIIEKKVYNKSKDLSEKLDDLKETLTDVKD